MLKENEELHYLFGNETMKIIQRKDMFHFSLDSVLIANFVTINKKCHNIVDLGTGNGPIPLMLSQRTNAQIIGVEIQDEAYDLAKRSVSLNKLMIELRSTCDLKDIHQRIGHQYFDVVTCNPHISKLTR